MSSTVEITIEFDTDNPTEQAVHSYLTDMIERGSGWLRYDITNEEGTTLDAQTKS